jgi:hypothetical protein
MKLLRVDDHGGLPQRRKEGEASHWTNLEEDEEEEEEEEEEDNERL